MTGSRAGLRGFGSEAGSGAAVVGMKLLEDEEPFAVPYEGA